MLDLEAAVAEIVARQAGYGRFWPSTEPPCSDDPAPHRNLDVGFRYIDRFERRESGQWRIARRVATTEWAETGDPARAFPPADGLRLGQRNRSDVLYEMLADLNS